MSRDSRQILGVLCATALALALILGLARHDPGRRNFEIFTEMAYSVAGESWMPSDVFADGRTLQPLVAGVVTHDREPFSYGSTPEEAERAGRELVNPLAGDPDAAAAGARHFATFCSACHDTRGGGEGRAVLRGLPPPPSLHADRARSLPDGRIFHLLTHGQGRMLPFAAQLAPAERWQVVSYVRFLQQEGP